MMIDSITIARELFLTQDKDLFLLLFILVHIWNVLRTPRLESQFYSSFRIFKFKFRLEGIIFEITKDFLCY